MPNKSIQEVKDVQKEYGPDQPQEAHRGSAGVYAGCSIADERLLQKRLSCIVVSVLPLLRLVTGFCPGVTHGREQF